MGFGAVAAWALVKLELCGSGAGDSGSYGGGDDRCAGAVCAGGSQAGGDFGGDLCRDDAPACGLECKATFWRWEALPYTCCMVFPMASGAAVGLLPGVAIQYGVNGNSVAWMNGLLGGALMAAGSAAAAILPTRVRAAVMYMVVALVNCAMLCVLWLGPLRPSTYYAGVTLLPVYDLGTCYSMFTAVLLEFMGHSGKSGSGRYSIINSLGNVPVQYMLLVDGWGGDKWGGRGLAGSEAVVGAVGAVILLAYFLTHQRTAPGAMTIEP